MTITLDKDIIMPDGSLHANEWYLFWRKGNQTACLDGYFTADDLEAIAKHMRENS